ncbi:peptidoglycan-binding protein [Nakamurella flava]|uniref:peptidoglycan-binding protein n=1 Tax=Nakamurella flava TaxID=2576308 RepID=UPI00140A156C|nr:peptidoglycan-binding protein [Nakamurella flava]
MDPSATDPTTVLPQQPRPVDVSPGWVALPNEAPPDEAAADVPPPADQGPAVTDDELTAPPPSRGGWLAGRRAVVVTAVVAVVMAGAGFAAATLVVSPADAALRSAPPAARPITVPVASRQLSSTVVTRGDIGFSESVEVKLTAAAGTTSVVTGRVPEVGSEVSAGTVILEVAGRPVLALPGALPAYRSLGGGSTGPDVTQLETALAGMGFDPGPQDGTYDAATAAAVAALYASRQYPAPGAAAEAQAAVASATEQQNAAKAADAEAEKALAAAQAGPPRSTRLGLQGAVDQAQAALDTAQNTGSAPDATAVAQASAALDAARAAAAQAADALTATQQSGGDIAAAQAAVGRADAEVSAAQARFDRASTPGPPDAAAIAAAKNQLAVAQAQREEGLRTDTAGAQAALDAANAQLRQATDALTAAQAAAITPLPAAEVVWLPTLPRRVDEVTTSLGATVSGAFLRVSAADLTVRARITAEEASLLKPGAIATLTARGFPELNATVVSVGKPAATGDSGADNGSSGNGGSGDGGSGDGGTSGGGQTPTGSQEVTLQPQNLPADQAVALRGTNVKVTIPVASTDGDVLVVPLAALFTQASGSTSVEIVGTDGVTTRQQPVTVGLSAGGEAEVTPLTADGAPAATGADTLRAGDAVVVGR